MNSRNQADFRAHLNRHTWSSIQIKRQTKRTRVNGPKFIKHGARAKLTRRSVYKSRGHTNWCAHAHLEVWRLTVLRFVFTNRLKECCPGEHEWLCLKPKPTKIDQGGNQDSLLPSLSRRFCRRRQCLVKYLIDAGALFGKNRQIRSHVLLFNALQFEHPEDDDRRAHESLSSDIWGQSDD